MAVIQFAIIKYNSVQSCVRWIPRTKEEDYVIIKDGDGYMFTVSYYIYGKFEYTLSTFDNKKI